MTDFWQHALLDPLTAMGARFVALLPNLLAMLVIVTVGWVSAWLAGLVVERLLRFLGLDRLGNRLGLHAALTRAGVKTDASMLAGAVAYWAVLLLALTTGLSALNVAPINHVAESLLAYIPFLFTAILILIAGYLLSNFVAQAVLIAAVNAGLPPARAVANFARWGVQLAAVAMALEQMGIAQHIVVVGFGVTLGAIALAAAIAFGLGAQGLARDYLERRLGQRPAETKQPDDLRHL
jgi:Conserved TM helix